MLDKLGGKMEPFSHVNLIDQTPMQKMLKILPTENAFNELQNILAEKSMTEFSQYDIDDINSKYKLQVTKKFSKDIQKLFANFAKFYLSKELPNDGLHYLPKLAEYLGIDQQEGYEILFPICKTIYLENYRCAIQDRELTVEEKLKLESLRNNLGMPQNMIEKIEKDAKEEFINSYIIEIIKDGEISPDEDEALTRISQSLSVNVVMDDKDRIALEKLRMIWRINHSDLPTIQPDILLQKNELCYCIKFVDWYELRVVRNKVHYGGVSGRIKIMKGVYYRYGSLQGRTEPISEMTKIDSGNVYITNKRIIFTGKNRNINIQNSHILNITPYTDGVEIIKDSGKNPILLFNDNVDVFCAILTRVLAS
jgi:hypothetical protein